MGNEGADETSIHVNESGFAKEIEASPHSRMTSFFWRLFFQKNDRWRGKRTMKKLDSHHYCYINAWKKRKQHPRKWKERKKLNLIFHKNGRKIRNTHIRQTVRGADCKSERAIELWYYNPYCKRRQLARKLLGYEVLPLLCLGRVLPPILLIQKLKSYFILSEFSSSPVRDVTFVFFRSFLVSLFVPRDSLLCEHQLSPSSYCTLSIVHFSIAVFPMRHQLL